MIVLTNFTWESIRNLFRISTRYLPHPDQIEMNQIKVEIEFFLRLNIPINQRNRKSLIHSKLLWNLRLNKSKIIQAKLCFRILERKIIYRLYRRLLIHWNLWRMISKRKSHQFTANHQEFSTGANLKAKRMWIITRRLKKWLNKLCK